MSHSEGHAPCMKRPAKAGRCVGKRQPLQRKVICRPLNLSTKVRPTNAVSLGPSY